MANVCMSTASVNAVARPKLPRIAAARAATSAGAQLLRRLPGRSLRLSAAPFPASAAKRYVFCKNQANSVDSISANNVQEMSVYEINEEDRGSPAYLRLSQKDVSSIGDLAPFTNKLYTGDLKKRAGITAGICIFIKHEPQKKGDRYEAIYSFYLGDYGHISVQGAYLTYQTTYLAVKGGSGVFEGASGQAKLNQISPKAGLITFYLKGIPQLPPELLGEVVPPSPNVEPTAAAKACAARATLPNFTD